MQKDVSVYIGDVMGCNRINTADTTTYNSAEYLTKVNANTCSPEARGCVLTG